MTMNTLGERIKLLREGHSQKWLADMLSIPQTTLSNYENNKSELNFSMIDAIVRIFKVRIEWLLFGTGSMLHDEATPKALADGDTDIIMIPRVSARLCAGTGSLETDGNVLDMYAFRADWILKKGNTKRMVLMDVTGDSMSPAILHGDTVLIDQSKTDIYGHSYYAVGIEDVIYLKEVLTEPGILIFRSINKKKYRDIRIDLRTEQAENVRIIGRVLWVSRELS